MRAPGADGARDRTRHQCRRRARAGTCSGPPTTSSRQEHCDRRGRVTSRRSPSWSCTSAGAGPRLVGPDAAAYWPDAVVNISWLAGPAHEFVRGLRGDERSGRGSRRTASPLSSSRPRATAPSPRHAPQSRWWRRAIRSPSCSPLSPGSSTACCGRDGHWRLLRLETAIVPERDAPRCRRSRRETRSTRPRSRGSDGPTACSPGT